MALPIVAFWMEGKSTVKEHLLASKIIAVRVGDKFTNTLSGRQMSMRAAHEALTCVDNDWQAQLIGLGASPQPRQVCAVDLLACPYSLASVASSKFMVLHRRKWTILRTPLSHHHLLMIWLKFLTSRTAPLVCLHNPLWAVPCALLCGSTDK